MKGGIFIGIADLDNVGFANGKYGIFFKEGNEVVFSPKGRSFNIKKILRGFEKQEIVFNLTTKYGEHEIFCEIPRSAMDAKGIQKLRAKGFDVKMSALDIFQLAMDKREEAYLKKYKVSSFHEEVGWEKVTSENEIDGLKAPLGYTYKYYGHIGNIKSEYRGCMDIKPRGTFKNQITFIKKEVQGYTPCETALAIGLSAVVNGLISNQVKTPNLIVHLYGDSSKGKTTAAQLAVSVAGIPDFQGTTLSKSWNATDNSTISRCKGNRGMPIAIDEISKYEGHNMSRLIYSLSDGRDKERLNRDATLRVVEKHDSFSTTIISTGEATITSKCKNNTGLKARVIEINAQFTKDAEHANRIKEACFTDCGWLAPALAKYMENMGMEYLLQKHTHWTEKYCNTTTIDTLKERTAANYAVIVMSAELANEAFGFSFDLDKMLNFFIQNEADNSPERDLAELAYEKLIDFARSNYGHFTKFYHGTKNLSRNNISDSMMILGRIDEGLEKTYDGEKIIGEFCFSANYFGDIVKKLGFEDEKVVLYKLREAGYLNHEKNKLYRKRKLREDDGTTTRMYVLYEFEEIKEITYQDTFVEIEDKENPFGE